MKTSVLVAAVALAAVGIASSASAAVFTSPTTLDNLLIPGNTMDSGSLVFSNWTYVGSASPTGLAIPASAINVTPTVLNGNSGVQFASGWNVSTQSGNVSSFEDSLITFTVTGPNLTDIHLLFNGGFTGNGVSGVSETYTADGSTNEVNVSNPPGIFDAPVATFAPTDSITVTKDINVTSGVDNGEVASTASISDVTNTYSQGVPEPASLSLLAMGMGGLMLRRRRR